MNSRNNLVELTLDKKKFQEEVATMEDYPGSAHGDINMVFKAFENGKLEFVTVLAEAQTDQQLRTAAMTWRSAPKYMTVLHCALRFAQFPLALRILKVTNRQAANAVTGSSNQPLSWSCLHILSESCVSTNLASGHGSSHEIPLQTMMQELI